MYLGFPLSLRNIENLRQVTQWRWRLEEIFVKIAAETLY